jgi:hypothetical protein
MEEGSIARVCLIHLGRKRSFVLYTYPFSYKRSFGTRIYAMTGDRHEGMYYKHFRHGIGTYVWSNGDKYVGNWRLGKVRMMESHNVEIQVLGTLFL